MIVHLLDQLESNGTSNNDASELSLQLDGEDDPQPRQSIPRVDNGEVIDWLRQHAHMVAISKRELKDRVGVGEGPRTELCMTDMN